MRLAFRAKRVMRPNDPIVPALACELEGHAKRREKRLRRAEKGDPDGVHGARTAVRRLRIALDVLSIVAPEISELKRFDDRLRTLGKALGKVRDDDVLLDHVRRRA